MLASAGEKMLNPMQCSSLSRFVRYFKAKSTYEINKGKINRDFAWMRSFHDRIIRSKEELYNVRKYIRDNPRNWFRDSKNLKKCST
jgi:hypothetical protein